MDDKHNYFLDTEFDERTGGFSIDPISYGLVHETGEGYYGVSREFNEAGRFQWLQDHVITKLPPVDFRKSLAQIRSDVIGFIQPAQEIDIWAYNGSTDFFVFYKLWDNQLAFREALKKAHGIQKVNFREMKEVSYMCVGLKMPEQTSPDHVAINDAHHERARFGAISNWVRTNDPKLATTLRLRLS